MNLDVYMWAMCTRCSLANSAINISQVIRAFQFVQQYINHLFDDQNKNWLYVFTSPAIYFRKHSCTEVWTERVRGGKRVLLPTKNE